MVSLSKPGGSGMGCAGSSGKTGFCDCGSAGTAVEAAAAATSFTKSRLRIEDLPGGGFGARGSIAGTDRPGASRRSVPLSLQPLFVVVEEGEDVVVPEAVAAFEEVEFDSEGEAGYFSSELLDEFDGGFHGAASGEEV